MDKPVQLDEPGMLAALREACNTAGNVNKWAESHGVRSQFVYDLLKGNRPIPDSVARTLGYARSVKYDLVEVVDASN